ncbi:MAG: hypothetical protein AB8F95_05690 [Bacteroidia bacterium]
MAESSSKTNLTPYYIIIGVLAVLALTFGILWGLNFFGKDYKKESQVLTSKVTVLTDSLQKVNMSDATLREQLGMSLSNGFEVQMGFYKEYDFGALDQELLQLSRYYDEGGAKFVLGRFQNFEDAENMVDELRSMGLKDAFIAGLADGERTTVEEAKKAVARAYGDY